MMEPLFLGKSGFTAGLIGTGGVLRSAFTKITWIEQGSIYCYNCFCSIIAIKDEGVFSTIKHLSSLGANSLETEK